MQGDALTKIFLQLQKSKYKIFGPKEQDDELHILELDAPPLNLPPDYGGEKIIRPWKYFFTPERETLYNNKNGKLKVPSQKSPFFAGFFAKATNPGKASKGKEKMALFGMSIFDCKALELYDKVFADDLYYQQNRKNIFVVGYSPVPLEKIKTLFFEVNLANAVFDIFIESLSAPSLSESANLKFYAQSKKGEEVLKKCGIKYNLVKYAPRKDDPTSPVLRMRLRNGTARLHGVDKKVLVIKKAMEESFGSKMWDELGKICLACGKCTIACPTCYCFDMESQIGPECKTERCSGNCLYDDFTRIAGPPAKAGEPSGHKFLNSPAEKIFFWYYHKFVRIPHGYGLPGCTDCGRCTAVCPVGINIKKNIERLLKEEKKKK